MATPSSSPGLGQHTYFGQTGGWWAQEILLLIATLAIYLEQASVHGNYLDPSAVAPAAVVARTIVKATLVEN